MLPKLPKVRLAVAPLLLVLVALTACSGGEPTGPEPVPPVITITGVEDGQVLEEAVTISVTVDFGTFTATLNGEPFFSGATVSDPGSYILQVDATHRGLTSSETVNFEIRFSGESLLIIRMLDLGENGAGGGGDAILVTDSSATGMRHALFDAGPEGPDGSNLSFVQSRLAEFGVDTLQVMVLTHAHTDHYFGMGPILQGTVVEEFFYNGQVRSLSSYMSVISSAEARAGAVVVPTETVTRQMGLGGVLTELDIIPGLPDHLDTDTNDGSDLNDGSLGTAVTKGSFRMFVTGDGETDANRRWRQQYGSLTENLTVLKVGHHGANDAVFDEGFSGSGTSWLQHTDADVHLVSANGSSHPRIAALNALKGRPAATYCTNVHGDIELRATATGQWTVTVERNASEDCVPGNEATS